MGFVPNQLARALATGRSDLIGVIVPNSSDLDHADVIRAIEDSASAAQFHVMLCNGSYRMETYTARVRDMRRLHMKGIIAAPPFTASRPRLPQFWKDLAPQRFRGGARQPPARPAIFHQVAADYMSGVGMVARALAERGHKRVAYISGTPEVLPFKQRLEVFRHCIEEVRLRQRRDAVRAGRARPAPAATRPAGGCGRRTAASRRRWWRRTTPRRWACCATWTRWA